MLLACPLGSGIHFSGERIVDLYSQWPKPQSSEVARDTLGSARVRLGRAAVLSLRDLNT